SAELDVAIKQPIEKVRGGEPYLRQGKSAQCVASEHVDAGRATLCQQLKGVAHIRRGKQVDLLALLDSLTQDSGRAKNGLDRDTRALAIVVADRPDDLAQTAGGSNTQLIRQRISNHRD